MNLRLDGLGNPGWTFTENRMYQLGELFRFINQKKTSDAFNYKELQKQIEKESKKLDGSKVRMFFPWLYKFGVFNNYNSIKIYGELQTELGQGFNQYCEIYINLKILEEKKELSEDKIVANNRVFGDFMFEFYNKIAQGEDGEIYRLVIELLSIFKCLTYDEYYVLTHAIKNDKERDWILSTIKKMRNSNTTPNVEIISNKNSYNYVIPFLKQAKIVKESKRIVTPNFNGNFNEVKK